MISSWSDSVAWKNAVMPVEEDLDLDVRISVKGCRNYFYMTSSGGGGSQW